jgi:AcrR family transcriptional regulator
MNDSEVYMGKREEQKEYRRLQILQIALEQFISKGFHGTSTREISKIAGVSSGLMFHYFKSKEALYEALIENACEAMVFDYSENDSPVKVFEQKLTEVFQMIASNSGAAKMFVFMGSAAYNAAKISPKAGEMLARHDIIRQSIPLIEKGQQLGEIREGNPCGLSIAFWCAIQGIAEEIATNPKAPYPEVNWILSIIKKEKGDG